MLDLDDKATKYLGFVLTHEVGFTLELIQEIVGHVVAGESFPGIEARLADRYKSQLNRLEAQCLASNRQCLDRWETTPGYCEWLRTAFPSDDLMMGVFLHYFQKHRNYITKCMASLPCDVLRIDHTFKSAGNIGWSRERDDGKCDWVTQYSAVFTVLQRDGLVGAWQFCANTKHSTVKNLPSGILGRRSRVRTVFTDQCCTDRKFIRSIFGSEVLVFLDTFHFKQRLTRALPKHPRKLFLSGQIKKLFKGSRHWTRQEIIDGLDEWWNLAVKEGCGTQTLLKAVDAAKGHVHKGCLDQNNLGTQCNEGVHKDQNRVMLSCRHGVEYALAKLALFYHHRNWRLAKKKNLPIEFELWPHLCSEPCDLPDTNEVFEVPQDLQEDAPEEVDEDQLVEFWDAICAAGACVRDEMNDLFLQRP